MSRKTKFIIAICLVAESFTTIVLSLIYAERRKELSRALFGVGLLSGLGGAYLLYNEYRQSRDEQFICDGDEWCSDDHDLDDQDFFSDVNADDINFTIAEEDGAPADA